MMQVGINDFYVRYYTVQLLTVLLQVWLCRGNDPVLEKLGELLAKNNCISMQGY